MHLFERLAATLEERIPGASGHSQRVAAYAGELAGVVGLSGEEADRIARAGSVHDIGKVCVSGTLLNKAGRLTPRERETIRQHVVTGAAMVAALRDDELTACVRHHHERFDGAGYPDGLAGEEIPLGARIIAVADTFDALTTDRPYREGVPHERALSVLTAAAGTQLDPELVVPFRDRFAVPVAV